MYSKIDFDLKTVNSNVDQFDSKLTNATGTKFSVRIYI